MNFDTIVSGGGPAGLSVGIRLARLGERVLLIERRGMPQEKCCGEFLHPSAVNELRILLKTETSGTPIRRVLVSSGTTFHIFLLADEGLALTRLELSAALLAAAESAKVRILSNRTAEWVGMDERSVEIQAGTDRHIAKKLILAEGSSSPNTRKIGVRRTASTKIYGFSTRMTAHLPNTVALAAIRGGYAGLCDLGNGIVNMAGLLSDEACRRLAPSKPNFPGRLLSEAPAWDAWVNSSLEEILFQAPVSCGEIRQTPDLPDRVFVVGDAAGMSETAFGDGIARSFRQARILEESLMRHPENLKSAAQHYLSRITDDAHRPNRFLLRLAGTLLRFPPAAAACLRLASPLIGALTRAATTAAQPMNDFQRNPANALAGTT